MHPASTRDAPAQLQSARAPSVAAVAAAAAAAPLIPLEDPNLPGPHQSHAGARTPSCPRLCATVHTQLRNIRARHCLVWGRRFAAL
eukprot:702357-Prymnesium_polylepis.1